MFLRIKISSTQRHPREIPQHDIKGFLSCTHIRCSKTGWDGHLSHIWKGGGLNKRTPAPHFADNSPPQPAHRQHQRARGLTTGGCLPGKGSVIRGEVPWESKHFSHITSAKILCHSPGKMLQLVCRPWKLRCRGRLGKQLCYPESQLGRRLPEWRLGTQCSLNWVCEAAMAHKSIRKTCV